MKTTPTTTPAGNSKQSPADHSVEGGSKQSAAVPAVDPKQRVTYPDLEGFVPDGYLTVDVPPEYGKKPCVDEE